MRRSIIPPRTSTGSSRAIGRNQQTFGNRGLVTKINISSTPKHPSSFRYAARSVQRWTSGEEERVEPIRSWTFASEPKFTRYRPTKTEKYVLVEKISEPAVRVLEDICEVVVVAYLSGVEEKDIHIELHGDILDISAQAKDEFGLKKYAKEILLPFMADPSAAKTSFKNDILEIKLREKRKKKRNGG